ARSQAARNRKAAKRPAQIYPGIPGPEKAPRRHPPRTPARCQAAGPAAAARYQPANRGHHRRNSPLAGRQGNHQAGPRKARHLR
nr:hypothetical protein [Tanacetum cinerariifolium]